MQRAIGDEGGARLCVEQRAQSHRVRLRALEPLLERDELALALVEVAPAPLRLLLPLGRDVLPVRHVAQRRAQLRLRPLVLAGGPRLQRAFARERALEEAEHAAEERAGQVAQRARVYAHLRVARALVPARARCGRLGGRRASVPASRAPACRRRRAAPPRRATCS